ncbi:MAG: 5-formyltetrahydrofolate cyclo-ligase [Bacteroidia bacterium]|nr:5-formyltetrahydrofolate cyclo-ligase [Bacteroidia bacterium]
MDKSEEKKVLRRGIRMRKASLDEAEKAAAAASVAAQIEALAEYADAQTLLAYCAMPDEIGTADIISRAYASGKTVVLPVVVGEKLELRKYTPAKLRPGYRGIMEPSDEAETVSPSDVDLAIIPGMAFDAAGHRMGRGGGFYDRLIPQLHCPLVGICFSCQIVPSIPLEPFDLPVDIVISE